MRSALWATLGIAILLSVLNWVLFVTAGHTISLAVGIVTLLAVAYMSYVLGKTR